MTLTPRLLAAWTAPATSDLGAWSPPIASSAMVSMWGRATPARLRRLRALYIGRTWGRPDGAAWARDSSDIPKDRTASAHRARGGWRSASGSVYVWDSASFNLRSIPMGPATDPKFGPGEPTLNS